ncbi:MAG TPA: phosphate ABC transporter ATP-binding protein [Acidobacteriaceae bacterium]|nr:phosphate ABC transporter ATP-binding protein [Acidobacteriaceae bacterium]
MPQPPAVLEAIALSRTVENVREGPKSLLRNIDLRLEQGQVLAVIGPSGAGKSTLLRLLNRLDEPTSGQLLLQGKDFRELEPAQLRRRIGMVMQRAYLFPGTVGSNIAYGPAQHGVSLDHDQVEALLEHVGMSGYAERDAATLSGGEAQRISIARALANHPEVLLLDEPTSALDDTSKAGVERLLATIVRERETTCVWVTHDLGQTRRVADLVLSMRDGQTVAIGPPAQVLDA